MRFVIFNPKRSLPNHPSFEMHYVCKKERRTSEMLPKYYKSFGRKNLPRDLIFMTSARFCSTAVLKSLPNFACFVLDLNMTIQTSRDLTLSEVSRDSKVDISLHSTKENTFPRLRVMIISSRVRSTSHCFGTVDPLGSSHSVPDAVGTAGNRRSNKCALQRKAETVYILLKCSFLHDVQIFKRYLNLRDGTPASTKVTHGNISANVAGANPAERLFL